MSFLDNEPIAKGGKTSIEDKDLFNFKHYAKKVQKIIQNNADNSAPLTIGIYGKWGEGKTSFLNLIENKIDSWVKEGKEKGILKYHFNPWRYNTEDEMLFDFFDGLSNMMYADEETSIQKTAKKITEYYEFVERIKLKGKVGLITRIINSFALIFKKEKKNLKELIKSINDKLEESTYKIVVFIDDIDRLDKEEIYTVLKLIKLNANFNNFVYIVALDEEYVAKAISKRYGDNIEDGELFLEKIINIPIHLPKVEEEDFKSFFYLKLKEVINNLGFSEREGEVKDIKKEFKTIYFKNGRDVIRVLNSFFITAFAIGEDVNLRDLFWLEYLKVNYSTVFNSVKSGDLFTYDNGLIRIKDFSKEPEDENILKEDSNNIVAELFPNSTSFFGQEKRRVNLRIDHQENFEKYFSYHNERKISSFKKSRLLQFIKDKNGNSLKDSLINLQEDKNIEDNLFYNLIKELIGVENIEYDFFYGFLFSNLELFPKVNINNSNSEFNTFKVIELICRSIENKGLSVLLSLEKLTLEELSFCIRSLTGNPNLLEIAEKEYLNRVKEKFNSENTSLIKSDLSGVMKRLVISVKKKHEPNKYIDNLFNEINNLEEVKNMIRIFLIKEYRDYELLEKKEYDYMVKLLDGDLLYKKIEGYSIDLVENVDSTQDVNDFFNDANNGILEQFVYWHKKHLDNK